MTITINEPLEFVKFQNTKFQETLLKSLKKSVFVADCLDGGFFMKVLSEDSVEVELMEDMSPSSTSNIFTIKIDSEHLDEDLSFELRYGMCTVEFSVPANLVVRLANRKYLALVVKVALYNNTVTLHIVDSVTGVVLVDKKISVRTVAVVLVESFSSREMVLQETVKLACDMSNIPVQLADLIWLQKSMQLALSSSKLNTEEITKIELQELLLQTFIKFMLHISIEQSTVNWDSEIKVQFYNTANYLSNLLGLTEELK